MQVTARLYPTGISVISKCDVNVIVSFWIVIKLKEKKKMLFDPKGICAHDPVAIDVCTIEHI